MTQHARSLRGNFSSQFLRLFVPFLATLLPSVCSVPIFYRDLKSAVSTLNQASLRVCVMHGFFSIAKISKRVH